MLLNHLTPGNTEELAILYIDDEPNNLLSFKATFRNDFTIFTAESALEGKRILNQNNISLILTDQRMPVMTGVEFLTSISEEYPDVIKILITGFSDIQTIIEAVNDGGIYHYVQKPWEELYLKRVLYNAFEIHRLRQEHSYMLDQLKLSNQQLELLLSESRDK